MLFKLTGGIVVILCCYTWGFYMSKMGAFRMQDLEQLKKAITIFNAEIKYSATPLYEVFNEISNRTNGVVAMAFEAATEGFLDKKEKTADEIWNKAVIDVQHNAYFNAEDMEYLFSFGRTLGFADKEMQVQNATLLLDYIENAQQELREKRKVEERLYKTLGLLGGIMVCIILF
jgi:Stage III sporulation protein AB (spore_III_AB).